MDLKSFEKLLKTLKGISLINKKISEKNGCVEDLKMPAILMTHNFKRPEITQQFFNLA